MNYQTYSNIHILVSYTALCLFNTLTRRIIIYCNLRTRQKTIMKKRIYTHHGHGHVRRVQCPRPSEGTRKWHRSHLLFYFLAIQTYALIYHKQAEKDVIFLTIQLYSFWRYSRFTENILCSKIWLPLQRSQLTMALK